MGRLRHVRGGVNRGRAQAGPAHRHPPGKLGLSPGCRRMDGRTESGGGGGGLPFLSILISLGNEAARASPRHNAPACCRIRHRGGKASPGGGGGTPEIRYRNPSPRCWKSLHGEPQAQAQPHMSHQQIPHTHTPRGSSCCDPPPQLRPLLPPPKTTPQHPPGLTSSYPAKGDGWGRIRPLPQLRAVVSSGSRRPQLPQFRPPWGSHTPPSLLAHPPLQ